MELQLWITCMDGRALTLSTGPARVRASVSRSRPQGPGYQTQDGILNYVLTVHCVVGQDRVQRWHLYEFE